MGGGGVSPPPNGPAGNPESIIPVSSTFKGYGINQINVYLKKSIHCNESFKYLGIRSIYCL